MQKKTKDKLTELEHDLAHAGDPLGKSEIALGVMSGAVVGALAGIPGAIVGAVIGGAAGVAGAVASGREAESREAENADLDAKIGVSGGDLGAPSLKHPPAERGTFSAEAAGVGAGGSTVPAEGPAPPADSED